MYSGGFVRLDEEAFKHASDGADWTDQETLLLLEGIEMFDENWAKVAEHVGTRSKEQCVMHFLRLPIEDEYLDGGSGSGSGLVGVGLSTDAAGNLPFSRSENPVMSVVAFLASAVGPGVAAAAAQSALGELAAEMAKKAKAQEKKQEEDKKQEETEAASQEQPLASTTEKEDDKMEGEQEASAESAAQPSSEKQDTGDVGGMDVDGEVGAEEKKQSAESSIPSSSVEKVAALALGAAAAKASALAMHEERHIQSLVSRLITAQMKKLELKMSMFERFEEMLESERRQLEVQKQQFFREKLSLSSQLKTVQDLLAKASAGGMGQEEAKAGLETANAIQKQLTPTTNSEVKPGTNGDVEAPTDGAILTLQ